MNINKILKEGNRPLPVLSFPGTQLLGINVRQLISDSTLQAKCMKAVADRVKPLASVSFMDLSVEAECFGSTIKVTDNDVPTVVGRIVETMEDAENLKVPEVGVKRSGIYVDAIKQAKELITDRPVLAGVIGPFSLAGRLVDVSEAMILCYEDPDMINVVLEKATEFIIKYINEYKKVGADGIVMAEPLTGMLSPSLAEEFSTPYVKKIREAVEDENFVFVYHNCGNGTIRMINSILETGCKYLHFGDAIDLRDMMPLIPKDTYVFGNISPSKYFLSGTKESMYEVTTKLLEDMKGYKNFGLSSGCDIPPLSSWDNIDAFIKAFEDFQNK